MRKAVKMRGRKPDPNNLYSDDRGIWKEATLWKAVRGHAVTRLDMSHEIIVKFMETCKVAEMGLETFDDVAEYILRCSSADLSFPIIVSETGAIMDGCHRIMRARVLGVPSIDAVLLKKDPPPDVPCR